MKNNEFFLYINLKDKYFWKVFFIVQFLITFLVIFYGPRNTGYLQVVGDGYNGYRPIGYPIILYIISFFFKFETSKYIAIFINGIFFSFIFSVVCAFSKKYYTNFSINLIFLFFLFPLLYEVFVIRETLLYSFLTILLIINFNDWQNKNIFYGLVLGLLFITRPTGVVGIVTFILITIYTLTFFSEDKKNYIKNFLNTFFWFFIVASISIVFIYLKFDIFILSSSCTGSLNIFKGLSSINSMAYIYSDLDGIDSLIKLSHITICQDINFFRDLINILTQQISIFEFIKSFALKFILFFFSYLPLGSADLTLLDNNQIQVTNFQLSIFRVLVSIVSLLLSLLALMVLIVRYFRNNLNKFDYFILFYCLGHAAIYSITWPEARFKFPIDPILVIYIQFPLNSKGQNFINLTTILINFIKNFFNRIKRI